MDSERELSTEKENYLYKKAVDDARDIILFIDKEGRIIKANNQAVKAYGYTQKELCNLYIWNLRDPKNLDIAKQQFKTAHADGILFETVHYRKDGTFFPVEVNSIRVDNTVLSIIRDITERKTLQKRVNENEERWRVALESSGFGVWDWNIENDEVFYSKLWKQMLGYSEDEIQNNYNEWLSRLHPNDYDYVIGKLKGHFEENSGYVVEYRMRNKNGSYIWIRTRGKVIGWSSDGRPQRMIGTSVDITEQKLMEEEIIKSEEKYRLLYSSMSQGMALHEIIVDDKGEPCDYRFIDINQSFERLTGLKKEDIIGKAVLEVLPGTEDYWIREYGEVALTGCPKQFENYSSELNKYYSVSVYSPQYMQFAVLVTDITEREKKELELREKYQELTAVYEELTAAEEELRSNYKELERLKEEADKANRVKSQFLANMSHEIRTPMNGIVCIADLLSFTELNQQQREYLDMLKSSSQMLMDIINSVLDISKIEAGRLEISNKPFDLKDNIDKIVRELWIAAQNKGIDLMYFIEPFTVTNIIGDSLKLNQIIINLVNNAIKFTEKGHIILRVKEKTRMSNSVKLQFSIEDTGIGISEHVKSELFKVFSQGDISYTKKYGGTGLGLAISKELVNLMNGEIWVDSIPGAGSTFYFTAEFTINISGMEAPNASDDNKAERYADSSLNSLKKSMILIVEDNEINQKVTSAYLEQSGYRYLRAYNGREAVEVIRNNNIDLVLMDIQMPELNGFEATRIIRESEKGGHKHVHIIAMTAYAMTGDRVKCIEEGMDDYISKPIDSCELLDKIKKYLKQ